MPVITISRGSFSAGKMLAELLAQRLGYRSLDRDQIIQKAAVWGVPQMSFGPQSKSRPAF